MALGYCPAMLLSLRNLVGNNSPSTKITGPGLLYALLDPQTTGDSIDFGSNGHLIGADNTDAARYAGVDTFGKPIVNIKYKVPNQAGIQSVIDCAINGTPVDSESQFALQFFKSKSIYFDFARIQNLCEDASKVAALGVGNSVVQWGSVNNSPLMNEVAQTIEGEMRGLVAALNADAWTRIAAGIGTNGGNLDVDGITPLATTQSVTLTNADGSINYTGFNKIMQDAMLNETTGKPIIVGGSKFNSFALLQKWGCCSNSGIDYAKVFQDSPMMFYFDRIADSALGAGQFLVMEPGSAQFVKHNRYAGYFAKKHGISEYGQYRDRRLPITFDLEVAETNCPRPGLQVTISLMYDVWVKPPVFATGDILAGNRGIYRYTAV
jgi:hypothetical protein